MEEGQSCNISANELDEETRSKLRGDTIGDTLYSETFVLKTLLGLADLKYTEEEENDLCFLWDMTTEKEVCKYLVDVKFPAVVTTALEGCSNVRYIEILVGTLANVILLSDYDKNISEMEICSVLKEFDTTDSQILIQLMRFVFCVTYKLPKFVSLFESEISRFQFILGNSQNRELLTETFQALHVLLGNLNPNLSCITSELFLAIMEGFSTIVAGEEFDFDILDSEDTTLTLKAFLTALTNFCIYTLNSEKDYAALPQLINDNRQLKAFIIQVIQHFSIEPSLCPIASYFNDAFSCFTLVFESSAPLLQNIIQQIFNPLCGIISLLEPCKEELDDSYKVVLELAAKICYLLEDQIVLEHLKTVDRRKLQLVLKCLSEKVETFEDDISSKLTFFEVELKNG